MSKTLPRWFGRKAEKKIGKKDKKSQEKTIYSKSNKNGHRSYEISVSYSENLDREYQEPNDKEVDIATISQQKRRPSLEQQKQTGYSPVTDHTWLLNQTIKDGNVESMKVKEMNESVLRINPLPESEPEKNGNNMPAIYGGR